MYVCSKHSLFNKLLSMVLMLFQLNQFCLWKGFLVCDIIFGSNVKLFRGINIHQVIFKNGPMKERQNSSKLLDFKTKGNNQILTKRNRILVTLSPLFQRDDFLSTFLVPNLNLSQGVEIRELSRSGFWFRRRTFLFGGGRSALSPGSGGSFNTSFAGFCLREVVASLVLLSPVLYRGSPAPL